MRRRLYARDGLKALGGVFLTLLLAPGVALMQSDGERVSIESRSGEPGVVRCANLVYGGGKTSVCFADKFLTDVGRKTHVDPTVAYHERILLVQGDEVLDEMPVDLRGW